MILIRCGAFILAVECLILLLFTPRPSAASAILAALFFLFFLILCWTFRTSANRKATS